MRLKASIAGVAVIALVACTPSDDPTTPTSTAPPTSSTSVETADPTPATETTQAGLPEQGVFEEYADEDYPTEVNGWTLRFVMGLPTYEDEGRAHYFHLALPGTSRYESLDSITKYSMPQGYEEPVPNVRCADISGFEACLALREDGRVFETNWAEGHKDMELLAQLTWDLANLFP